MATETPLLIVHNVEESYPNQAPTLGTLTISLVRFQFNEGASTHCETYLDLTLPSGANLPLPASTSVWQPTATSFSIELSPSTQEYLLDATGDTPSAETRLELAQATGPPSRSEILETLQVIFAQYTRFAHPELTPGSLVLMAEENGAPIANLQVRPPAQPLPDDKSPVVVEVVGSEDDAGGAVASVRPATEEEKAALEEEESAGELRASRLPEAYKDDKFVGAAVGVSQGLVLCSRTLAQGMNKAADWYVLSRPGAETPVEFKESTKSRVHRAAQISGTGARYTRKASAAVQNLAEGLGARLARREAKAGAGRPSFLNRTLVAFTTVMDGLDEATQTVVGGATGSSAKVVGHAYGAEARELAEEVGRSVRHVAAVYVDVKGVSRKAIVRGVGKGAIRGVSGRGEGGGGDVVVFGGDGKTGSV